MPFVTQPTESALAHRDSWAKSKLKYCLGLMIGLMTLYSFLDAIENVHKDSMAKDANTSADAKMEQSTYSLHTFDYFYNILYFVGVMRRAENATVSQVGLGFFAIHLVLLVDMDKIARRNVTVKMERLVVILQVKYNHLF